MTCCNNKHPRLANPIDTGAFLYDLERLCSMVGITPRAIFDPKLDIAHRRSSRRYGQVDYDTRRFEFSSAILWLPVRNRRGLIAHEIGHLLLWRDGFKNHTENDADDTAEDAFGRPVLYDLRWPGKGLQSW